MAILRKQVFKQAIGGPEGKTEIIAISNRYTDTLVNLIDSLDKEPQNMSRPVDKGSRNIMPNSEDSLTEPELDKNISNKS